MIYLKTYFYVKFEIDYLILNLLESYNFIDKFIIVEHNRTHTGKPREFIFDNYIHQFPEEIRDKILYIKSDISKESIETDDENIIHSVNEPLMRGDFVKYVNLNDDDIIFSVDADEIIYSDVYPEIIKMVNEGQTVLLSLHQFFYKHNYLWVNNNFTAPTVAKYKTYKDIYPNQWRYQGVNFYKKAGCHFSWCMTVEDMIYKLNTYSHPQYRWCANKELLENAIKEKTYPFDKNVNFQIKELTMTETDLLLPKNYKNILNLF